MLRLGSAWVIEAGHASDAQVEALQALADPTDERAVALLEPVEVLGPATLAYLPPGTDAGHGVALSADLREIARSDAEAMLRTLPAADVAEGAINDMQVILLAENDGVVLGAAGHVDWPRDIAHIGVVVAPEHQGQGVGTALGNAATQRAIALGRCPQWRARRDNAASRATARRLGFVEFGIQLSMRLR